MDNSVRTPSSHQLGLGLDRLPNGLIGKLPSKNDIYCIMNQVFDVHGVNSSMVVDEAKGTAKRTAVTAKAG